MRKPKPRIPHLPSLSERLRDPEMFREIVLRRIEIFRTRKPFPKKQLADMVHLLNQLDYDPSLHPMAQRAHTTGEATHHTGYHGDARLIWDDDKPCVTVEPPSEDDIDAGLGWAEPDGQPVDNKQDKDFERAGELLNTIVVWLAGSASMTSAGLKAMALVTMLRPDLVNRVAPGRRKSGFMSQTAENMGVTRAAVQKYGREIRALAHGRFQSVVNSPNNSIGASQRAIAQHVKAGHVIHAREDDV